MKASLSISQLWHPSVLTEETWVPNEEVTLTPKPDVHMRAVISHTLKVKDTKAPETETHSRLLSTSSTTAESGSHPADNGINGALGSDRGYCPRMEDWEESRMEWTTKMILSGGSRQRLQLLLGDLPNSTE
ncbi:unnamed protein product [Leuciscus chuanchicus]